LLSRGYGVRADCPAGRSAAAPEGAGRGRAGNRALSWPRRWRLDARSRDGGWTLRTLELIRAQPGVRAGEPCGVTGQEKARFKQNVGKLEHPRLTESLDTGHRRSLRGRVLLRAEEENRCSAGAREERY
jgi:hypothetical protein